MPTTTTHNKYAEVLINKFLQETRCSSKYCTRWNSSNWKHGKLVPWIKGQEDGTKKLELYK